MKIAHIAMWTKNIENMKNFYLKYFNATAQEKYINAQKNFESYFLTFEFGAKLELMFMPSIKNKATENNSQHLGLIHLAFSVGSKEKVDSLTIQFKNDGYVILSAPRLTGDGYYESAILDPEGNVIEITE